MKISGTTRFSHLGRGSKGIDPWKQPAYRVSHDENSSKHNFQFVSSDQIILAISNQSSFENF